MEQSDLELLRIVPGYHLQAVAKLRQISLALLPANPAQGSGSQALPTSVFTDFAQALFEHAAVQRILASTELAERTVAHQVLRELVNCGGRANSRDLALYIGYASEVEREQRDQKVASEAGSTMRSAHYPQYPTAQPHGAFELAMRHLLLLGLVFWGRQTNFMGREYGSGVHDGVLIVPESIQEIIRQAWSAPEGSHTVIATVNEAMLTFQRNLYLYYALVASTRDGLATMNSGMLTRSALRGVLEQFEKGAEQVRMEHEVPRLLFMRLLLIRLGVLQDRQGAIVAVPSAAEAFFRLSPAERGHRCVGVSVSDPFWNELLYLPDVNIRPGPVAGEPAHDEVIRSRKLVLERLLQEPLENWCDLATFIARTKLYLPSLLFPRQYGARAERYSSGSNPYNWDFRLKRGWLTHREGWHVIEGGFIRTFITGPLHWLGCIEVAHEEDVARFKLASSLPTFLSQEPIGEQEHAGGKLIVQPNFEVVVLAPVSEGLLVLLDRFADRVSLEHIAQYRLSKASVTRAIQQGLRADDMLAQLLRVVQGELPQNVRYSLNEWERQARRIEIWPGSTLIEVAESALLDRYFSETETRALFRRRLAPTIAEIAPEKLAEVQDLLWSQHYLPALSTAKERVRQREVGLEQGEAQWRLHSDGVLEPCYAVTDLYLQKEVATFSQIEPERGWQQISENSLQGALTQGWTLEQIIRFLHNYCEMGIPGSFLIKLKLWGGGYQQQRTVFVERAPLLRLSAEVLRDARQDEELRELLGAEVTQEHRLVHVAEPQLARVIEILKQRGFSCDE